MDRVAAPAGLANVPAVGLFVGRHGDLEDLDQVLASSGSHVMVLHGLGGVGKSTLAAQWAATRTAGCSPVWWIACDTSTALDTGLVELAAALQPGLRGTVPTETLTDRANAWLAAHSGWLLILDNVSSPADVQALVAGARHGRFLITTRLGTGWHTITPVVKELGVLQPREAVELLTRIAAPSATAAPDGAEELCAELGFLALAVDQAAAYLAQAQITAGEYLELLARYPARLFGQAAEGGDAERTIARIWRVTLDQLGDTPLAGQVLRVLAWYAPDRIPRTLLDGIADPVEVNSALGRLAACNMLTLHPDHTISAHRLVQALARTPDPGDPHRHDADINAARDQATTLLAEAIPDYWQPAGWPLWQTLLPHITALANHTDPRTDSPATVFLLDRTGLYLDNQGAVGRAILLFERTLTNSVRALGADHPQTLASRNNLAYAYEAAGDLGRALPLFEQTLTDAERVLGADHPQTLTSCNNLAGAYETAGDLIRAIPLFEQTLTDRERVLGADHPDTLASRNNLAYAYRAAGDLGRALPLFEQTLADSVRALGADHPLPQAVRRDLEAAQAHVEV